MEEERQQLDLDSLLRSHRFSIGTGSCSSDDEDEFSLSGVHHRTVDEILLNHSSSSSSSPSPSPPPSPPSPPSTSYLQYDAGRSSGSTRTLSAPRKLSSLSQHHNNSSSQSLLEHPDFNNDNINNSSINSTIKSGQLSNYSLFGGVRSNAKPGAALAAAAAASRSVPTRHAALIKSRRATSLSKEEASGEEKLPSASFSSSSSDHNSNAGLPGSSENVGRLAPRGEDDNWDNFHSHLSDLNESNDNTRNSKKFSSGGDKNEEDEDVYVDGVDERLEVAERILRIGETPIERETTSVIVGCKLDQVTTIDDNEGRDDLGQLLSPVDSQIGESPGENGTGYSDLAEDPRIVSVLDENKDTELLFGKDGGIADEVCLTNDEITEKDIPSTLDYDKREIFEEGDTAFVGETEDQKEILVHPTEVGEEDSPGGDESGSLNNIADLIEDLTLQWESKKGSSKTWKKSRSSMKPLELAEELENRQAFTGLHLEEGAAAQPMRLEGERRGSTLLGYFDVDAHNTITQTVSSQAFKRDHGSPQVLAVHLNYIAIGMSRGVILVFPSKYTPHHADKIDAKMVMLGTQGDRSYVPVTSMCFNQQGDLLFAGYGDGHYTVWNVPRASALKVINEHKAPVVHMLYLGQDSQVTRQFNVVSGDTKGVVKLICFSVVPLLNRISYSKPVKLLDETTSTVVCASPLISGEIHGGTLMSSQGSTVSTGGIGSMMGGVVGGDAGWKLFEGSSSVEEGVVIFVTHQSALVAKVSPAVEVYAQLPKPDGVREGAMPYAAWKCMPSEGFPTEDVPPETPEKVYLLAIAWDRKVQVAKLVKSELKVYWKWTLDSPAVGIAWLNDQLLVILTSSGQLCLFSKDGNVIHQTSFDIHGSRGDDLISYHTYFRNSFGNPEKAHQNYVSVRGATVYILGPMHLIVSRLLPWRERIEVLQRAGDSMGALYMGMTFYDGQAQGVIDLPRNINDVQKTVMPSLVQLLLSYVDEVFSYLKVAFGEPVGNSNPAIDSNDRNNSEAKEQYSRVGGVAVEFCLHIKRTDILFDEIYMRFSTIGHQETFLELLEPYILKDMLGSLPPGIMQALVEHYSQKGWLQRVEQCVLHMDILSLDFNQVVRLCREHRLHGALIYLFNKGLDDYRTPLEELLVVLRNSQRERVPAVGYRILIYLKYCFQGLAFPPGHGCISSTRLPSLRTELVQFLLEDSSVRKALTSISSDGALRNLHHLLELDTEATLDVLKLAFVEDEILKPKHTSHDSTTLSVQSTEAEDYSSSGDNELVQKLVDVLCVILDTSYFQTESSTNSDDNGTSTEIWPSKKDVDHIFEFIAYYIACGRANVSRDILSQIVEHLTSEVKFSPSESHQTSVISKRREKQLLALLEAVPETDWDAPYLFHLCGKAQYHQACGLIHAIRHHYSAALDCYMKAVDEPIHAFSFIHYMLQKLGNKEPNDFRSAVISRIPDLVRLNREGAFFLVLYHFSGQHQQITSELHSHPESLFLYLKTVTEVHSNGTLDFSCLRKCFSLDFPIGKGAKHQTDRLEAFLSSIMDFPTLLRNNAVHVTDEMIELYLELLCRYERESVLKFLETFESYRVDHCLRLCQEFGVVDAAAFLLERVGDVGTALLLLLSGLSDKFITLTESMERESSDACKRNFDTISKKKEVYDILDTVHACVGLCQRNSSRLDPHESEFLWFKLLDSFCEPLMDGSDSEIASRHMAFSDVSLGKQEDEEASKIEWKVPKSHKGAHILRKLLSMFIKEIVEGMIGYVRLPEIMLKLLSDNGTQEFGDFKFTILGMLGMYDFERRILDTAKSLIEDDTYYTMSLLKKGASHGYAPRGLLCCLCNCLLTKNASGSGIQVYSCGHATHLHCELQEGEASSVREFAGCPICMPKKKAQRSRSKSGLAENGLVDISSSRAQQTHGTLALYLHDSDAFENSHSSHQISRFELLNNLQKDRRTIQIENVPQLKLAPPSLYHEKVKKGTDLIRGESSSSISKTEKPIRRKPLRDVKVKGSSISFPLRSNIFGKQKINKQQ